MVIKKIPKIVGKLKQQLKNKYKFKNCIPVQLHKWGANNSLHVSSEYPILVAISSWFPIVSLIPECKSYLKKNCTKTSQHIMSSCKINKKILMLLKIQYKIIERENMLHAL